ncbi:unnamed protein product [Pleuronectes platessa]|uniref:Matrin-type domain-containing protein n=1 Tax=Pleuronectes platessa TaxID=8262 RepID=A0A9N7UMC7_PLEPL|nr:unnamed protein product [Pleuronectes platessa]
MSQPLYLDHGLQKTFRYQQRTASSNSKSLAVHTDSYLHLAPTQRLEPRAALSIANSIRRNNFIRGPIAGAAAVTALHLAQIETQAQFALQQFASLATITVGIQCHNNRLAAALPRQLALLSLLNRREVSAIGFNLDTKSKTYKTTQLCLPATMYHHHSQQQGPQPFSNGPQPHHQSHPNQHQSHTPSDMLTQVMGFQFPRPTQLPEELESALAIRGARDMDHRLIDRMNTPNQHQNQASVSGISQHGTYGSTTLTSDSQPGHQQDIDWSSYQPPTKLFAAPPCSSNRQSHRQGPQQHPEINQAGTSIPGWTAAVYPHTCSLCHTQSDQEKDWVDHINTVNHTAACRDLRNKYPDWKPNLPSRSGRYGNQSPSHSTTRSHSSSPTPGPLNKHRVGTHPNRPHGKLYTPLHHPRYNHYSEHGNRLDSPCGSHRIYRVNRPEKRESSGVSSRSGVKHPNNDSTSQHPSSSKMGHILKHGPSQSKIVKSGTKTGTKMPTTASAKVTDTSVKPPQPKKKKKMVTPASQYSSVAERLVYLTGIPKDASEQEVTDLLGSFGKINNVILMPCSDEESDSSEGKKASVCMMKAEDAQALANSKALSIRDQQITASTAKKPEEGQSPDSSSSKPGTGQEKCTAGEDTGNETDKKTSDEKGVVLISGLSENSCSESDIIKLIQPFGTPSDIILATQIRKALVLVPDMELAQEIVKVHSFMPAKIGDSELKIILVKQRVGLSTPVALYNLMMESVDPSESPVPVCWNSLLVISNVPNTPSCSFEVQKLVRRFGTVIKTLVLNNMVICEMATAAMALSVYKRFHTFPCIIQNNPLFFSRKPDPKASTQTKVITAYLDSTEDLSANGKSSQSAAAADEEQMSQKEKSKCLLEVTVKDAAEMDKKMSTEETVGKQEALERDSKPEAASNSDARETSAGKTVSEAKEEKKVVSSEAGNDKTVVGEETKLMSADDKVASGETVMQIELPKVTQEMVNTLLVECRTRTMRHPDYVAASTSGVEWETPMEQGEKSVKDTKEQAKNSTDEETQLQEREKTEREARKEKEKEKRAWERERRANRERDEKEGYKHGSRRNVPNYNSEAEKTVDEEEEFPFNLSDFVTVDEVGDVTDLPRSPSPVIPMETTEVQQDTPEDTPMEVVTETTMKDAKESNEQVSECEPVSELTAENTDSSVSTPAEVLTTEKSTSLPASQAASSPSQSPAPTCQPEAADTEEILIATRDSAPEVEHLSISAPDNPPEAESEEDKKEDRGVNPSQAEEDSLDKSEEQEKMHSQEDKDTGTPAPETAKQESSDLTQDQTHNPKESVKKSETKTPMGTDCSLPPFDPSNPVGMEFLVPKTGFFCKVCNRFFSGTKEAEISHCKTAKHYENLLKYLQNMKTAKPDRGAETTD